MIGNLPYFAVAALVIFGLFGAIFGRNMVKIAVAVSLVEAATNLFIIALGYRNGGSIPVFSQAGEHAGYMVLPTPQALTLTAIVIGMATTALLLSLIMMLYRHYGTLDVREIRRLRG